MNAAESPPACVVQHHALPAPDSEAIQHVEGDLGDESRIPADILSTEGNADVSSRESNDLRAALAGADRVALVAACNSMERSIDELQKALLEQKRAVLYQARRRRGLESEVRRLREAIYRKHRFDAATAAGTPAAEAAEFAAAAEEKVPFLLQEDPLVAVPAFVDGIFKKYKAPALQLIDGVKQVHQQLAAELHHLQKYHQLQEAKRRQELRAKVLRQRQERMMQLSRQPETHVTRFSRERSVSKSVRERQFEPLNQQSGQTVNSVHSVTEQQTRQQAANPEGLVTRIQRIFRASDQLQTRLAACASDEQTKDPPKDIFHKENACAPVRETEGRRKLSGDKSYEVYGTEALAYKPSRDAESVEFLSKRSEVITTEQNAHIADDPLSFLADDARISNEADGFATDTTPAVVSPPTQDDSSCCVLYALIDVCDQTYALNVNATQSTEAAAENWVDQHWKILQQHWRGTAPSATFLERKRAISALAAFLSSEEEKAEQLPVHVSRSWSEILFPKGSL